MCACVCVFRRERSVLACWLLNFEILNELHRELFDGRSPPPLPHVRGFDCASPRFCPYFGSVTPPLFFFSFRLQSGCLSPAFCARFSLLHCSGTRTVDKDPTAGTGAFKTGASQRWDAKALSDDDAALKYFLGIFLRSQNLGIS